MLKKEKRKRDTLVRSNVIKDKEKENSNKILKQTIKKKHRKTKKKPQRSCQSSVLGVWNILNKMMISQCALFS